MPTWTTPDSAIACSPPGAPTRSSPRGCSTTRPKPKAALAALAELLAPGGTLLVIDYVAHQDEALRKEQADTWLGFEPKELRAWARAAGLEGATLTPIPSARCGQGPDGHLDWQVLAARRPED